MSFTIQLRRDTAANWASRNHVLASGELGIETDTDKAKIGNGTTAWNSLPYWSPAGNLTVSATPPSSPAVNDLWLQIGT